MNPKPLRVWYDVACDGVPGEGLPTARFPIGTALNIVRMWQRLNSKRTDLITFDGTAYRVVELRPVAKQQTVGELVTYDNLTRAEWPALKWARPVLVTQRLDGMTRAVVNAIDTDLIIAPMKMPTI